MPKNCTDKQELLEFYRQNHPDIVRITQEAMNQLSYKILDDPATKEAFCARLSECRQKRNYSMQELGEKLNVSHAQISNMENPVKCPKLDLIYLEILSLIFQVSPYYLLGKTSDAENYCMPPGEETDGPYIVPMIYCPQDIADLSNLIIISLAKIDSLDLSELLNFFTSLSRLNVTTKKGIISHLSFVPLVKQALCLDIKTHLDSIHDDWIRFIEANDPRFPQSLRIRYLDALALLGEPDTALLDFFAHVTIANSGALQYVCYALQQGGFFDPKSGFRQNDQSLGIFSTYNRPDQKP